MTQDNSKGSKKHFFSMPQEFSKLTDEQMEQFANQLHSQIMDAFGENFAVNDQEKNSNPDQKEKND
jgi:DNA-binding transcriptional regulator GbsR (MarR family)